MACRGVEEGMVVVVGGENLCPEFVGVRIVLYDLGGGGIYFVLSK